ncbi:hypothetical protein KSF78_0007751 [Schistosoma japonicum]|nr:hypothetical protein KSF78_0007751 [Schistosoma japonicum]
MQTIITPIPCSLLLENPADAIENAIEGIVEVQEELNKFERSLETTKKIIRQLINLVNKFESSLETIDEDIRLLISTINEANPNETETLKNLTDDLQCDIDNLKKEIERDYPNCYFKVIYFSSHFQYKDNFRRAIKMLSKRKGIQQLIFNITMIDMNDMELCLSAYLPLTTNIHQTFSYYTCQSVKHYIEIRTNDDIHLITVIRNSRLFITTSQYIHHIIQYELFSFSLICLIHIVILLHGYLLMSSGYVATTSQSEKSNMTCNRPENISEDDFNKLQKLLGKEQRTDLASTYIKLKKKALLLVWEDLTNARVVDDLITMNILKFSQITDLLSLNTLTQIPPPVLCSHYFDHLSIAFQPLSTTYHYVIKSHHFEPVSYKNTLIIPNRLQCNITDLQ